MINDTKNVKLIFLKNFYSENFGRKIDLFLARNFIFTRYFNGIIEELHDFKIYL